VATPQLGARSLFGLVYAASISSVYFALGVIAHHAQGLTPEVFILAAVFFQLTAMTYAEGASVHPEGRGGSAAFGRYAFNELVSFIAAWSLVLDYVILIAVTAITVPAYLAVFWAPLDHGTARLLASLVVIAVVTADSITGVGGQRLRRRLTLISVDLVVQVAVIVLGVVLVFHPANLTHAVHLSAGKPSLSGLGYALPVGVIAFAGLETASALASEVRVRPADLRKLMAAGSAAIIVVYVGIAVVGIAALPVHDGITSLGQTPIAAPVLGIVESFRPVGFADGLKYVVGVTGAAVLFSAAGVAQMGVSRVGYALATNRQIPSAIGRLSSRWSTPWIVILAAGLGAAALALTQNIELLVGIYAFGALVAFLVAHLSVIVMRFREPRRERAYRVPLSIPLRGGSLPMPTVLGALLSAAGWLALVTFHAGARWVGLGWLVGGVLWYVIYRRISGRPVLKRTVIPDRALRQVVKQAEFGSILVPIFGRGHDDDAVEVAGRLIDREYDGDQRGAIIEAIYVIEIPMQLSLDGPLPADHLKLAREALKHAKEVGERFADVEVATAVVRARRVGAGIVREARRRGVEAIVLAAEPGDEKREARSSGKFVGDVKYVIEKAPCRVIVTAPAIHRETSADG
jgi:APA family basic amino acid/polyamine antiporter